MAGFPIHDVAPDIRFRVVRLMPPLPDWLEGEIDRLWEEAQDRMRGALFNGRVFSADVITSRLVCGHWTEFRRIVAQMSRPTLHRHINVRPLAVGGVILGPEGVIFGRRPPGAIYQAGEWQLPPAGSVDPSSARADGEVDVIAQLLSELSEELGLPAEAVHDPRLLCIVEHPESHVLDLGISLRTSWRARALLAAHRDHANREYEPLAVVPLATLGAFLTSGEPINHQAPVFLRYAGLLT